MNPESKLSAFCRSTGVVVVMLTPVALLIWGLWALGGIMMGRGSP